MSHSNTTTVVAMPAQKTTTHTIQAFANITSGKNKGHSQQSAANRQTRRRVVPLHHIVAARLNPRYGSTQFHSPVQPSHITM